MFYPIFHYGLYCRAVNIAEHLHTKQGNSSIFELKIYGLLSRVGYNGACTVCGHDFGPLLTFCSLKVEKSWHFVDQPSTLSCSCSF
jgi:hypothetical protein